MKHCASCGREIPEAVTVCESCEAWAADQVANATIAAQTPPASVSVSAPAVSLPFVPPLSAPDRATDVTDSLSLSAAEPPAMDTTAWLPLSAPEPAIDAIAAVPPSAPKPGVDGAGAVSAPASMAVDKTPAPATTATRLGGRQLGLIVGGVAVVGVLMFTLMPSRAVSGARAAIPERTVPERSAAKAPRAVSHAAAAAPTQAWSTQRRAYWTGNQRHSVAFELPAENTVSIWMSQVRPLLIVRCLSRKPEVFVFTGSALKIEPDTDDHTVSFRFDDEAATTVRWPDSAEHDALFSPDAAGFAARLMHARTLRFGYTPHNASPVEAHFEVSGLPALIEPAAKDCGWKK